MINKLKITTALIKRYHPDFEFTVYKDTPVTLLDKPLHKCKLALITTGGIHLRSDVPFSLKVPGGDPSYRTVPDNVSYDDIRITHKWYNHKFINADINCVFPIDRMKEYVKKGKIHSLSEKHYSFMGHIYNVKPLIDNAKKTGHQLKKLGVDIAFLTPTWILCTQSVGLIARYLEKSGISTVIATFRKDITSLSRPPRILSVKSSAGRPLGTPGNVRLQRKVIEAGFELLQADIDDMTIMNIPAR